MKNIFLPFLAITISFLLFTSCNQHKQQKESEVPISEQIQEDDMEELLEMEAMDFESEIPNSLANNTAYFDDYDKIEVVFYPNAKRAMGLPGQVCGDLLKEGKFLVDSIQTRITLSDSQREQLITFLTTPYKATSIAVDCYKPKHAILFYKNEKVDSFLEICFGCSASCPKDDILQGRYDELEQLFESFSSDLVKK
ncbi:hypothetical protein [Bernardetia sp.]|uniref:hypothetical protein n=1 Tax=Bernardetia sp. TaxID=1937974 RepID=UPI0025BDA3CD|nr:hypothetical protein [Bernardetia sp.]